jgi:adenosylhomocysteine nucleosidase
MDRLHLIRPVRAFHLLILVFLLIGTGVPLSAQAGAAPRPYLILFAFDEEGKLLASQMKIDARDTVLGREVLWGELAGQRVLLAECGVGMTNAAMMTQRLIDFAGPKMVLLSGIAGAVDTAVHVGDIVIPDTWRQHDYGYIGAEGFQVSGIKIYDPRDRQFKRAEAFTAYSLSALRRETDSLDLKPVGARRPRVIIGGVGVSGNSFIDNKEKRIWLASRFSALVVDMESAAVAQVSVVNDLPFLIFRSASDLAGGSGSATASTEMEQFMGSAAQNSALVLRAFLGRLQM